MLHIALRQTTRVALFISIPALLAWLTGLPFIFPSLGPSAAILAINDPKIFSARRVIGGHCVGVLAGLAAYYSIASGLSLSHIASAFTVENARVVLSGACALVVTMLIMQLVRAVHPPACATTLMLSLGLISTLPDAVIIIAAVTALYAVYKLVVRWTKPP